MQLRFSLTLSLLVSGWQLSATATGQPHSEWPVPQLEEPFEKVSTVSTILGGEEADATEWYESPWFGWYWPVPDNEGWALSLDWDAYVYAVAGNADTLYLWEARSGSWFLTEPGLYPWMWSFASGEWVDAATPGVFGEWAFLKNIANGTQFDVVADSDGILHLLSRQYSQYDRRGQFLLVEFRGDAGQGKLNFPPAIAAGENGDIHIVTRSAPGFTDLTLRYNLRTKDTGWGQSYVYGTVSKRNYVVGVTVPEEAPPVLMHTTAYENVWGDVFLYEAGEDADTPLGSVMGIWRADNDARLKSYANKVFLIAGLNDPNGKATITWGEAGPNLALNLRVNRKYHEGGEGRRGFPDLAIDPDGRAHLIYGAYQTLQYNRYDTVGVRVFPNEKELFSDLGEWHLSCGMGAIAVSGDGSKVMAIALQTDGSKEADDSEILCSYSLDGGDTWSAPESLGIRTSGGEGRLRPRLVTIGSTFYLFYYDPQTNSISLGMCRL